MRMLSMYPKKKFLKRICNKCGTVFTKNSKYNKLCKKCQKIVRDNQVRKIRQRNITNQAREKKTTRGLITSSSLV